MSPHPTPAQAEPAARSLGGSVLATTRPSVCECLGALAGSRCREWTVHRLLREHVRDDQEEPSDFFTLHLPRTKLCS